MVKGRVMKQVITANTLKTGEVVFWGQSDWVSNIEDAALYSDDLDLTQEMKAISFPDHVVGVYSITVVVNEGAPVPHHIREKIRALGPRNYDHRRDGDTASMASFSTKHVPQQ